MKRATQNTTLAAAALDLAGVGVAEHIEINSLALIFRKLAPVPWCWNSASSDATTSSFSLTALASDNASDGKNNKRMESKYHEISINTNAINGAGNAVN
jgi:hypothetical protein